MTSVENLAKEWLRIDQDPSTREEISGLLSEGNHSELEVRLKHRITFGTAGLRARMEAGFSRINALTVIQTSQGFASYVLKQVTNAKRRGIVIGFDGRHNSEKFAKLAAAAFAAKGIKVWWLEILVHTPLVPFAISELRAAAGVMITASHNPPQDNGYKVYWENGCQIVSPHDSRITKAILANLEPLSWNDAVEEQSLLVEAVLSQMQEAYFRAIHRAVFVERNQMQPQTEPIRFVYTPLHGVGLPYLTRAVQDDNLSDSMTVVSQQAHPDPDFPTVKFPNPEEKGALDLAIQTADANNIDLVLANDPDADRFSAAIKVSSIWHQLTGNQIGILLASHMLETYTHQQHQEDRLSANTRPSSSTQPPKLVMLASAVSSRMLSAMAHAENFHFVETLTGFKWLGNAAQYLARSGNYDPIFAFEEAIGYMFPTVVADKDGIAAAAIFLRACLRWRADGGLSPWEKLQTLYQKYGFFAEENFYVVSPSVEVTDAAFARIRSMGKEEAEEGELVYPKRLGENRIVRWRDLTMGYDSATADRVPELPVQKDVQMLTAELENDVRFTVRASGTEPKVKVYIDAKAEDMDGAESKAREVGRAVRQEWLRGL
ncbi:MAG: hypothetical protein Q9157_008512 [Trypethelium eluteriae]